MASGAKAKYRIVAKNETGKAFSEVRQDADRVAKSVLGIGAAGAAAAAAGIAAMTSKGFELADSLDKVSLKIGVATEDLAGLRYAAEISGASQKSLDEAMVKSQKRLAEAAMGTGAAAKMIQQLGLDVKELQGLSPDQLFKRYADEINGLSNQGEKLAAMSALMGDESRKLFAMINSGVPEIERLEDRADKLGLTLSEVDTVQMVAAGDAIADIGKGMDGLAMNIGAQMAPYVQDLANRFFNVAEEAGGFGSIASKAMNHTITAIGYVGNAIHSLKAAWLFVKLGVGEFAEFAVEKLAFVGQKMQNMANKIPGVDLSFGSVLTDVSDVLAYQNEEIKNNLANLASEPWPLETVQAWSEEVKRVSTETAMAQVQIRQQAREQITAEEAVFSKTEAQLKREQATQEANEEYSILVWNWKRKQFVNQKYRKTEYQKDVANFKSLLSAGAQHNKTVFQINKTREIAEGILAMRSAITGAYKVGSNIGGPVLGAAFAATAGVAQAANVAAIKATSFGGGGGAGGAGGGTGNISIPSANSQAALPESAGGQGSRLPRINVNISDDAVLTGEWLRKFVDRLNEGVSSGEVELAF